MFRKAKLIVAIAVVLTLVGVLAVASRSSGRGLTFDVVSRSNDVQFGYCRVGMTNHGGTVVYDGYDKTSPVYSLVHETTSGATTNSAFWCGTGLRDVSLSHGEGVQFRIVFVATNAPSRMVFHYRDRSVFESMLAKAPAFVRQKLQGRNFHTADVRLQ